MVLPAAGFPWMHTRDARIPGPGHPALHPRRQAGVVRRRCFLLVLSSQNEMPSVHAGGILWLGSLRMRVVKNKIKHAFDSGLEIASVCVHTNFR